MNFEDEDYVRVYTRDTVTMAKIGWEGRTVLWHIMRKVERSGVLELEEGDDEAEAVAALCDLPEELARTGLARLASRGVTARHGSSLVLVRFVEAQNARRSDRLRAQDYRDRKRLGLLEENEDSSRPVTARHDSSPLPSPLPSPASPPCPEEADARGAPALAAAPAAAVRGLVPVRRPAPTNQPDALQLPIAERARLVLEDPGNGAWSSPQTWPEVVAVAEALARAAGQKRPRLGDCSRDVGVKTVLGHLADGWPVAELTELAGAIGRSKWWREGGSPRGLSSLTAEVLRRAQNERPRVASVDPEIARELAKSARMRAEYAAEQALTGGV